MMLKQQQHPEARVFMEDRLADVLLCGKRWARVLSQIELYHKDIDTL